MLRIVSGKYGGRYIKTLSEYDTRPTTNRIKESIFNIIQSKIPGSFVLDLFSGSGSLGLEALSRGCKKTVLVEKNRNAFKVLKGNCIKLNCIDSVELLNMDAVKAIPYLANNQLLFDIIFMDPPYDNDVEYDVFDLIKENGLASDMGIIIFEHRTESKKPDEISGFARYDMRKYGYTSISFYRKDR